jgi:hypothetical protein
VLTELKETPGFCTTLREMPLTPEQKRERRAADKRALDAGDEGALKRRDAHATRMREARMVDKAKRAENDAAACGRAKKDKERMVEARRIDKLALEEGDDDALERSAKDKFRSETVQAANKLIEEIVREEANNVLVEFLEAEYRECMKCIESFQVDIDKNVPAYKSFDCETPPRNGANSASDSRQRQPLATAASDNRQRQPPATAASRQRQRQPTATALPATATSDSHQPSATATAAGGCVARHGFSTISRRFESRRTR